MRNSKVNQDRYSWICLQLHRRSIGYETIILYFQQRFTWFADVNQDFGELARTSYLCMQRESQFISLFR